MDMKMFGVTWIDKKRGAWIREQIKVEGIFKMIMADHIMHRTDNRWTKC